MYLSIVTSPVKQSFAEHKRREGRRNMEDGIKDIYILLDRPLATHQELNLNKINLLLEVFSIPQQ